MDPGPTAKLHTAKYDIFNSVFDVEMLTVELPFEKNGMVETNVEKNLKPIYSSVCGRDWVSLGLQACSEKHTSLSLRSASLSSYQGHPIISSLFSCITVMMFPNAALKNFPVHSVWVMYFLFHPLNWEHLRTECCLLLSF